jgi:hypothetical protein
MIGFNEKKDLWTYVVDGKIVCRSKDKTKLERMVQEKFGGEVTKGVIPVKSDFSVNERFDFISQFTKLAAKGVIPGLVITGSGGLGKTYTVLQTLSKMGLKEDTIGTIDGDYVFIKGYTTPRNLYTTLYQNNGKVIVFDDCDTSFKDPIGANLFKAALDSYERRIISWGAESKDDEIPSRFEFTGKVIFISNLELGKFPQAILSRSMLTDLTLNLEEKVDRIKFIFNEDKRYDADDKSEVLEFIKKNMQKFKDLNLRSAMNILKMKVALGDNWERPALYSATLN